MSKKVCVELVCGYNGHPRTIFMMYHKQTNSTWISDILDEAEAIARERYPDLGVVISRHYHGHDDHIEFLDMDSPVACGKCVNAFVDSELEPDYDFSSRSVGDCNEGYRLMLNTGARRKTHISLERWNQEHKQWETEGFYVPKHCPECGRALAENAKGGTGLYITD